MVKLFWKVFVAQYISTILAPLTPTENIPTHSRNLVITFLRILFLVTIWCFVAPPPTSDWCHYCLPSITYFGLVIVQLTLLRITSIVGEVERLNYNTSYEIN